MKATQSTHVYSRLRRFVLDVRAMSAKKKVTKEILMAQKCFERI